MLGYFASDSSLFRRIQVDWDLRVVSRRRLAWRVCGLSFIWCVLVSNATREGGYGIGLR